MRYYIIFYIIQDKILLKYLWIKSHINLKSQKEFTANIPKILLEGEKSNRKLNLYFKVGIILSAYYSDTFNLKYLSALIKICDIISSSDEELYKILNFR